MEKFNFKRFAYNLGKNTYITSIQNTNNSVVMLTYSDGQVLHVDTVGDDYHRFYTYIPINNDSNYYMGRMPHDNYNDLYHEINRMNTVSSRHLPCRSPYFKSDDLLF